MSPMNHNWAVSIELCRNLPNTTNLPGSLEPLGRLKRKRLDALASFPKCE
jgi:hypothetical protein